MRFADFLRTTVLASAGAASVLAALTVAGAAGDSNDLIVPFSAAWWVAAGAIGIWLGRRAETSPPIASLLASARTQASLPEVNPARTMLNRLWPLLISTVGAGALAFLVPQVPAVATGFAIIWSLAWRRQASAVRAIEERDGARFYVDKTSPLKPIRLVRTPGFRSNLFELERGVGPLPPRPTARVIYPAFIPSPPQQRLLPRAAVRPRLRAGLRVRGGGGDLRHPVALAPGRRRSRTSATRRPRGAFRPG